MPKPIDKRDVRGRSPVDPSFKAPTPEVYAKPTDPFVAPREHNETAQILGTLAKLAKTGAEIGGREAVLSRQEGERDALAGKAPEPGLMESSYVAGYDKITGEHNANEYHRAIWAYFANNKEKDETAFQAGLNDLRAKHLAANVSDDALDGFLPKAVAADEDIQKRFTAYKTDAALSDMREMARSNLDTFFRENLVSVLNKHGIPSLDALNTPAGIQAFEANRQAIVEEIVPILRGGLTGYHEKYKGVMSRAEVSEMTVELLTGLAVMTNTPEILQFAYVKDSNGRALVHYNDPKGNPFGPAVEAAQIKAEDRKIKTLNFMEERERRQAKEAAEMTAQGIINDARQLWTNKDTHPQALAGLRERVSKLSESPGATPSLINDLFMVVDTAEKRRNHPAQSDIDVRENLAMKYAMGNLKVRDVIANRWKLSEGDHDKLLGYAQEQEEQIRNRDRTGNDAYFTNRNNVHIAYDRFYNSINPKNALTGLYYDRAGAEKARDAQRMFQREVINYQNSHGGNSPDIDALEKIEKKVYDRYPAYVKLKPEEFAKVRKEMVESGRMPKDSADKFRKWGVLSTREREVADELIQD